MKKRILAIVLSVMMIISVLPATVFAEDEVVKCPGEGKVHTLDNCTATQLSVIPATCEEGHSHGGFTLYECRGCGENFAADFVDKDSVHEWELTSEAKAATCTEPGQKTDAYKCKVCGATKGGEVLEALGHDYDEPEITGDCIEGGKSVSKCKTCGDVKTVLIPAEGHKWSEHPVEIRKEPTHAEKGVAVYRCEVCNEEREVEILTTTEHTKVVAHEEVPSTCTKAGTKAYWECLDCHKLYADEKLTKEIEKPEALPLAAHNELNHYDAAEATCIKAGNIEYWECKACGKLFSADKATTETEIKAEDVIVDKKEHSFTEEGEKVAATCTEKGYTLYHCSQEGCDAVKKDVDEEEPAHKWEQKGEPVAPTCTEKGYTIYICSVCGEKKQDDETDMVAHTKPTDSEKITTVAATCEEAGSETYNCTVCGKEVAKITDAALGHTKPTDPEKITTVAATCEEAGSETYTCTVCEAEAVEVSPALGHDFTVEVERKPVTCQESGYTAHKKCSHDGCDAVEGKEEILFDFDATYADYDAAKAAHNNGLAADAKDTKAPTCVADGYKVYECGECGKTAKVILPKTENEHDAEAVAAVPATCEKAGVKGYEKCKDCGKISTDDGNTWVEADEADLAGDAATGHNLKEDVTVPRTATCGVFGYTYHHKICQNENCNYVEEYIDNYVPALEHEWMKDEINSTDVSCTKDGVYVEICVNCHATKTTEKKATGHHNENGDLLENSCTNEVEDRVCKDCGDTIGQNHPADKVSVIKIAKTCQNYAYDVEWCAECGRYEIIKNYEEEGKGAHVFGDWVVTTEPTTTEAGVETRTCELCGETETRNIDELPSGISAAFEIKNAAREDAGFTDSSLVAVKVVLDAERYSVWAINFSVKYDKDVVEFEDYEFVNEKLNTNCLAASVEEDDGEGNTVNKVNIIAQAPNSDDKEKQNVTLDGKEALVVLYFRIISDTAEETSFAFGDDQIETINFEGETSTAGGKSAGITIEEFLDINADGDFNLADILAVYKMTIGGGEATYDVVVDVNKDGVVNTEDLLYLYRYKVGAIDYATLTALRPQA